MVKKRPQLSPDDLGRLRWGLGAVLALLSVVTVFFMEVDAWLFMPAVTIAAVAAVIFPRWPARVPRLVHRLAFPAIVVVFVYDLTSGGEPLPSLIRLDLLLILYRVVTYRQRRDDLQLVLLGLFLVIVAGVITVSISFAVQLIAFTGGALVMLLAVTLEHADGVSPQPIPPGVVPTWARGTWRSLFMRLRAALDLRIVALGVTGFAALVVLSGLLFLAIPRFELQNNLFLDRLISRATRTGFSETIHFGDVTGITQDNSLAFSVDLTDPKAMPVAPYWRMVVLDEYTGDGFRMSDEFRRTVNGLRPLSRHLVGRGQFLRGAPQWTVYMETGVSRFLPLLGNFYTIDFNEPKTFSLSDELRVVALQRDPSKMFAFRIAGLDTSGQLKDATFALRRRTGDPRGQRFLELPTDASTRARLERTLATIRPTAGLMTGAADATDFAIAATHWLDARHAYSLTSSVPTGEGDTLARWLESDRPGHCEFFAGALVLLARSAGLPARLVVGFRGGAWNDYSGSYAVRNANAHAWCEIFDDASATWLRFDPTPGNQTAAGTGADPAAAAAAVIQRDASWNARLESLRVFWYRRIVNFDLDTQVKLITRTKTLFAGIRDRFIAWADARAAALRHWLNRPWNPVRWGWVGALVVAALAAIGWWRWRGARWWWRVRRSTRPARQDPVRRAAGRWLARARRRTGFRWPEALESALLRLRFGDAAGWPDPATVFRQARAAWNRG